MMPLPAFDTTGDLPPVYIVLHWMRCYGASVQQVGSGVYVPAVCPTSTD